MAEPAAPPLWRLQALPARIDGRGQWPDPSRPVTFGVALETEAA